MTGEPRMIIAAYGLALDAPLLIRWLPGGSLPPVAAPAGLVVEATGLALRAWSMRALGGSYSRTLRVVEDEDQQTVVDAGPYRLIRHPGYLGSLLTWVGFASPRAVCPSSPSLSGCSVLPTNGASLPRSSFFDVICPATAPTASGPRSSSPSSGSSLWQLPYPRHAYGHLATERRFYRWGIGFWDRQGKLALLALYWRRAQCSGKRRPVRDSCSAPPASRRRPPVTPGVPAPATDRRGGHAYGGGSPGASRRSSRGVGFFRRGGRGPARGP
jgi:hypothetical protein